jgi:TP901 family phage tail tape measure protein
MAINSFFNIIVGTKGEAKVDGMRKSVKGLTTSLNNNSTAAKRATKEIKRYKDVFKGSVLANLVSNASRAIQSLSRNALQSSLDFEQAVANVNSIKKIDVSQVTKKISELSAEIGQSASSLADGLYDIFSNLDATQKQGLKLLKTYSKGAIAAGTDAKTFGKAISGVLNAYKKDFSEATKVTDVFFNVVKRGGATGEQLARELARVTQPAKNLGISFEQLGGLIAGVTREGEMANVSINNLANFLRKLPIGDARKQLTKLGIALNDGAGNFRSVFDILTDLKKILDTLSDEKRVALIAKIFPDQQAQQALTNLLSQLDHSKNVALENAKAIGEMDAAFSIMSKTGTVALNKLKQSFNLFLKTFADWTIQSELGIRTINFLSKTFSKYSRTVVSLTGTLVSLTIAVKSLTIAAGLAKLGAALKGALALVISLRSAITGLRITTIATAATLTTVTGGLFALVGVIGALITAVIGVHYWFKDYNKVVGESTEQTVKTATESAKLITEYEKTIKILEQLEGKTLDYITKNKELAGLYGQLDDPTKARIKQLSDEKKSYKELTAEVQKLIDKERERFTQKIALIGDDMRENAKKILDQRTELEMTRAELKKAESDLKIEEKIRKSFESTKGKSAIQDTLWSMRGVLSITGQESEDSLRKRVKRLRRQENTQYEAVNKLEQVDQRTLALKRQAYRVLQANGKLTDAQKTLLGIPIIKKSGGGGGGGDGGGTGNTGLKEVKDQIKRITQADLRKLLETELPIGIGSGRRKVRGTGLENVEKPILEPLPEAPEMALVVQLYLEQKKQLEDLGEEYNAKQELFSHRLFRRHAQDLQVLGDKLKLQTEIFNLENKIATQGGNAAERYQKAWLNAIYQIRDANIKAVESQIEANVKLSDQMNFHSEQVRASVLGHLASQKSLSQAVSTDIIGLYDRLAKRSDELLGSLGKIPILGAVVRTVSRRGLTNLTRGLMDAFLPPSISAMLEPANNNPISTPIVEQVKVSNTLLGNIYNALTGRSAPGVPAAANFFRSPSPGGGGLGGLFATLGAAGGAAHLAKFLPPNFNPNAGGAFGGGLGGWSGFNFNPKSIWKGFKNFFTGKNFKPGTLLGDLGAVGRGGLLGTMLGGLIGGGVGRTISTIGGAAAAGSMLGGPIGGIAGGILGGIIGIFTRGRRRRRDERTRNAAMIKTLRMLNRIKTLINQIPPGMDLDTAASRARAIEQEYFSAMGGLGDGKTRRIALKDGRERVTPLVQQILQDIERIRAEVQAREANRKEVASKFTGQFAKGGFISGDSLALYRGFKRRNGMLGGVWTGRDYLPSLLADEEMVINKPQIDRIRSLAGFDVFKHANIPNYKPKQTEAPRYFASGVNIGNNIGRAQSESRAQVNLGDIVINLNGKRIKDAEIESIAIGGVLKYQKSKGRIIS